MKYIIPVFIIALSGMLSSFQHSPISHDIQSDTTISNPLSIDPECASWDLGTLRQQKFLVYPENKFPCDGDIDFSLYSLVRISYDYSGCSDVIHRELKCYFNHQTQKVIIRLILYEKDYCRPLYHGMDWFLIPKIPKGYSVELIHSVTKHVE